MNNNKHWYKRWWGVTMIFLAFLVVSFIFACFLYVVSLTRNIRENQFSQFVAVKQDPETIKTIEGSGKYWFGTPNPKVTIVEFGDYTCPFCAKSHAKIREISLKYKNYVKFIFRDSPYGPFLEDGDFTKDEYLQRSFLSWRLALAARCAGEQGLFWTMHDKLFLNQGKIETQENIYETAKQIGADKERFALCFENKKYLPNIQGDVKDAESLNIIDIGTPVWFINGNIIKGNIPYEFFMELIENLIALK